MSLDRRTRGVLVDDYDVRAAHGLDRSHGEQLGVAWSGADERDAADGLLLGRACTHGCSLVVTGSTVSSSRAASWRPAASASSTGVVMDMRVTAEPSAEARSASRVSSGSENPSSLTTPRAPTGAEHPASRAA